jgi:DNA-binding LacI/PurR family transcriptional regulator
MARVALSWGVRDLSREAGVSVDTVARLERGEQLKPQTVERIRQTFEQAGIEFIPENGRGIGIRLKKKQR